MSKYDFSGTNNIGSIGDGNNTTNIFNVINGDSTINYKEIVNELNGLHLSLIKKENKLVEEKSLQVDIEEMLQINNKDVLLKKISEKASKLFYDSSIGIGAGVLANYIFKFLTG